jgi:gliding motility associated protien GldN
MKKFVFILFLVLGLSATSNVAEAQTVLDGLYPKEHVANRKPIPFAHVREADVLWARKIWRVIDLREKINLPMYYPINPMDDRYSLINLLLYGIQYEGLTAYSNKDDEFKVAISWDQVQQEMGAVNDTTQVKNPDTGIWETKIIGGTIRPDEVKQILVKEIWFFDRNYSRMDVRIVGICPIREYERSEEGAESQIVKRQAFWIYYPEVRDLFARHEVFNPRNDAQRRTFDDIFLKRYFGSYIVKEANVYGNRSIESYTAGMEAMMESERIRNNLFTLEHDMWEF